ncbi:MAG: RHS repeat-associated core domain-containing protein [Gammaproteobacteria bacterium]|nr:RHS repeat-associated core domain-containing protein [Gammaproteobacteria bacterium]
MFNDLPESEHSLAAWSVLRRLQSRTYPNGVKTSWQYEADTGRLKSITHNKSDTSLIYSDTFTYVPNTTLYSRITRTTASSVSNTDYTYDGNQRLETVTEADGRNTVFVYDAFGNRTQETITNLNNPAASGGTPKAYGVYRYAYDGNRLQTVYYTPPAGSEAVQKQLTYDSVGRIQTRSHATNGLTTYTWDDRGYLIKLQKPGTTVDYAYNALGARVSKTVNGQTTKYLTAPVFGMNHVLMELDSNNSVTARHVYGDHEPLAEEIGGASQYLLPGGSTGNITHALSSSAAVINEYRYDAFGSRTLVSGNTTTRHGYTGEEYDANTGLLYLRARYYDPQLGRFISVDPFLGRMAEPATQNRYVYVMNNPLSFVDPRGLASIEACGDAFSIGGAGGCAILDLATLDVYSKVMPGLGNSSGYSLMLSTATPSNGVTLEGTVGGRLYGPIHGALTASANLTEFNERGLAFAAPSLVDDKRNADLSLGLAWGEGTIAGGTAYTEKKFNLIEEIDKQHYSANEWVRSKLDPTYSPPPSVCRYK